MLDEVDRSDYSRAETAQIVNLMCKYSFWMLDMTNTEYIHALAGGAASGFSETFTGADQRFPGL